MPEILLRIFTRFRSKQGQVMKLSVIRSSEDTTGVFTDVGQKRIVVATEHQGNSIYWNVLSRTTTYTKDEMGELDIFTQLNQYLDSLPETKQHAIFEIYQRAHAIFDLLTSKGMDDVELLARKLRPIVRDLFNECPPEHIYQWVWFTLVPSLPQDMRHRFTPEMPGTPQRTYLVDDYRQLIPMTIILRLAFPIISEYIHTAKDELGRYHREYNAFSLLDMAWVYDCSAMERLYVFTDHTVGSDRTNENAIMVGIGSENFIRWVLSFLVVRKLMVVDVRGTNVPSVISTLFNAIDSRVKMIINNSRNIKIKKTSEGGSNDPENVSILESFRIKEELTTGDIAIFRQYVSLQIQSATSNQKPNKLSLMERVAPGISAQLVRDCVESVSILKNLNIVPTQVVFAMWVFADYLTPMVSPHLTKTNVLDVLAMAMAVFIHNGQLDFAMIVSAHYRMPDMDEEQSLGESTSPIPKALLAEFREIFPYLKRGGFEGGSAKALVNLPERTIDEFVQNLKSFEIRSTISEKIIERYLGGMSIPKMYYPPKSIRIKIVEQLMAHDKRVPIHANPLAFVKAKPQG